MSEASGDYRVFTLGSWRRCWAWGYTNPLLGCTGPACVGILSADALMFLQSNIHRRIRALLTKYRLVAAGVSPSLSQACTFCSWRNECFHLTSVYSNSSIVWSFYSHFQNFFCCPWPLHTQTARRLPEVIEVDTMKSSEIVDWCGAIRGSEFPLWLLWEWNCWFVKSPVTSGVA